MFVFYSRNFTNSSYALIYICSCANAWSILNKCMNQSAVWIRIDQRLGLGANRLKLGTNRLYLAVKRLGAKWPWLRNDRVPLDWDGCCFSSLLRGFYSGSSSFPPSLKTNISNFRFDLEQWQEELPSGMSTAKSHYYLIIIFVLSSNDFNKS